MSSFLICKSGMCQKQEFSELYKSKKSRGKNAQIEMGILGKFILIHLIDIKDFRPYTKKTHHYKI